jgi:hypothetical protein
MRNDRDESVAEWHTVTGLVLPEELKWPAGSTRAEIIAHLKRLLADDALSPEGAQFVRKAFESTDSHPPLNEEL